MILELKSALNICFSRWDPISYVIFHIMEIDRIRSCVCGEVNGSNKII